MKRTELFYKILLSMFPMTIVGYIFLSNLAPFGLTRAYISGTSSHISQLGPSTRVGETFINKEPIQKILHDMVYFSTDIDYHFEKAKIKITFQNPYPDQDIYLGFQDQDKWHYATQIIYTPILDNLNWISTGHNPTLFQKNFEYSSVTDFFHNPPLDKIIGIYNFDKNSLIQGDIPDYTPEENLTSIDSPLRGKHTLYAFLKNQPFKLAIQKQDLNWYEGPDILNIKVFKESQLVYSESVQDDGIENSSQQSLEAQEIVIEIPESNLPEPGVYKIVLETSSDVVIKKITTNLHKLVFEGPIFLAHNHLAYPQLFTDTQPSKLFTDALIITAKTYHAEGLQNIQIGSNQLEIKDLGQEEATATAEIVTQIELPANDVILNGVIGNFAFQESSLFKPTKYNLLPLTSSMDTQAVDFIISSYTPTKKSGDWNIAEIEFDLSTAVVKNGKLSWIIQSPKLTEQNREILIKNIEVELYKSPLLK